MTVPAQSSVVVQCPDPWVPVVENNGHECLLTQAYIPTFDPLTAPLDPVDDRHVGQKNEQLVLAPAGQALKIRLDALNISSLAQALSFEVQPLRARLLPPALARLAQRQARGVAPPTATLPLSMKLNEDGTFTGPSALFARRLLTRTLEELEGTARNCSVPAQVTHTATFAAWELRTLEINARIPPNARPGESFTFRVVQRAGDMVCGGYTVFVVVTGG